MSEEKDVLDIVIPPKYPEITFTEVLRKETNAINAKPCPHAMTLEPDVPRLPYRRRPFDVKPVLHWGQLKLFLSELQFLSEHGHFSNTVVYAGAAPGTHIKYLSSMFPQHKFILWDPRSFDVTGDMIETHEEYFTDDVAKTYAKQDILFISDIRTGSAADAPNEFEGRVSIDMEWQMKWHKIIRPAMGMYKFRLPYASGKTKYMSGTMQMQMYAPTSSTELRLIVPQEFKMREYDNDEVEEQMYHFNYITRPRWYGQQFRQFHLDGCWDCTAFIATVRKYLCNVKHFRAATKDIEKRVVLDHINNILKTCSKVNRLNTAPHGDGSQDSWFKRWRKYDNMPMNIKSRKKGLGISVEMVGIHRELLENAKKEDPKIKIPPMLDYRAD